MDRKEKVMINPKDKVEKCFEWSVIPSMKLSIILKELACYIIMQIKTTGGIEDYLQPKWL